MASPDHGQTDRDDVPSGRPVSLSEARRRLGRGLPALRRMVAEGTLRGVVDPTTGTLRVLLDVAVDGPAASADERSAEPSMAPIVLADGSVARCVAWRRELEAAGIPGPLVSVYDTPSLLLLIERVRPRLLLLGRMSHFDDPVRLVGWLRAASDLPQPPVAFAGDDLRPVIERLRAARTA